MNSSLREAIIESTIGAGFLICLVFIVCFGSLIRENREIKEVLIKEEQKEYIEKVVKEFLSDKK